MEIMCRLDGGDCRFSPASRHLAVRRTYHGIRRVLTGPRYRDIISTTTVAPLATTTIATFTAPFRTRLADWRQCACVRVCVCESARALTALCVCARTFFMLCILLRTIQNNSVRTRMHRSRYHGGSCLITHRLRLLLVSPS